jgi:hypothetical protein
MCRPIHNSTPDASTPSPAPTFVLGIDEGEQQPAVRFDAQGNRESTVLALGAALAASPRRTA